MARNVRIIGAWTTPEYRRQGVYSSLFEALAERYRKLGYHRVRSGFHKNNFASKSMQLKRGCTILPLTPNGHYRTIFHLQSTDDE